MFVQSKTYLKWQVAWDKACVIFPYVLLATKIFCHTYISLYRFLYIYWYIMLSNYASIKNNWYKSSVTRATNAIGRVVLWRHDSSFPSSLCFFPSSLAAILGRVDTGPIWYFPGAAVLPLSLVRNTDAILADAHTVTETPLKLEAQIR